MAAVGLRLFLLGVITGMAMAVTITAGPWWLIVVSGVTALVLFGGVVIDVTQRR